MEARRTARPDGVKGFCTRALRQLIGLAVITVVATTPTTAQRPSLEVRGGVVASSTLVEDAVANIPLQQALGRDFLGGVRAVPATSPILVLAFATPLRSRTALDISVGWTFGRLDARDENGTRELQDLGVGHAVAAIRYTVHPRLDGSCGFGIARYFADEVGLFVNGTEITPLLECGAGTSIAAAGQRFVLRLNGQAQRFRSPALRDARAQTGTVYRASLQLGMAFGNRP